MKSFQSIIPASSTLRKRRANEIQSRTKIITIKMEINKIEKQKTIEKSSEIKSWFFEKNQKTSSQTDQRK